MRQTLRRTTLGHFIGGRLVDRDGADGTPVYNPATGEITKHVAMGTAADVDTAVRAADDAFATWSATPAPRRAAVLFRFRELVLEHAGRLAGIITSEHGKTLPDAAGELQRGL